MKRRASLPNGAKPLLRGVESLPNGAARTRVAALLRELLAWQRQLRGWPDVRLRAPDATAFVSVYADGRLRGCFGVDAGKPGERIARAFLLAMHDARFGGLDAESEAKAAALVSYARSIAPMRVADAPSTIAAGKHGLFYVLEDGRGAMLLPQVARDEHLDARGLLAALAKKAGVVELAEGRLFVFETEDVSSLEAGGAWSDAVDEAASHLERVVDRAGHVDFMLDARTGARRRTGEMHHGRAGIVVRALEACGRKKTAARARRRLEKDIEAALRGRPPEGWPESPSMICGTLALAIRAGIDVTHDLERLSRREKFDGSTWHAAQVVAALGARAPRALYDACIADLAKSPWAPWTAIAAASRGDREGVKRCASALRARVREKPPHEGGVGFTNVPEIALTAVTVEALVHADDADSRGAVARARRFLGEWQNHPARPRGPVDPRIARGAFPLSPVNDALRSDVTGHAVLALLGR